MHLIICILRTNFAHIFKAFYMFAVWPFLFIVIQITLNNVCNLLVILSEHNQFLKARNCHFLIYFSKKIPTHICLYSFIY